MSFKKVEEMDEDDFLMSMRETPKPLKIIKVKDLKQSDSDDEGAYFYATFENSENFLTFDMSFNLKVNADKTLFVGSNSKLHPILSYVTGIDEGISCDDFEDIRESLEGLSFEAKTKREKYGNKKYFVIIPNQRRRA